MPTPQPPPPSPPSAAAAGNVDDDYNGRRYLDYDKEAVSECIARVAGKRKIFAACLYGSRAAGYARPESDYDIILVLENYPFVLKYVYDKKSRLEISVLVVDKRAMERDARASFLGEFVAGRLLHIYVPIINHEFLARVETLYKKRIILEEINNIARTANTLSSEILFPLDFVMFSKIKRRATLYPNAAYSYYKTYTGSNAKDNIEFALDGYRRALGEIIEQDNELFSHHNGLPNGMLQISEKRIKVGGQGGSQASLKLPSSLSALESYIVHTYAGVRAWHHAVKEAESKIRRHKINRIQFPEFISCPKGTFWKLPEGKLVFESRDWLSSIASHWGFEDFDILAKRRLGNINSRTVLYVIKERDGHGKKEVAVKEMAKSKAVKWAALSVWTSPVKKFRIDPLFRLGSEYRALRRVRSLGLRTPKIESVVLDRRILVTEFIQGATLADIIRQRQSPSKKDRDGKAQGSRHYQETEENSFHAYGDDNSIYMAGSQIAKIHNSGSSLGNIKPKNIVVRDGELYFTDLEQFQFDSGDNVWDLAQFISWGLKRIRSRDVATAVTKEFLQGYMESADGKTAENIKKLSRSRRHIESFYPVLVPSVARAIKKEIKIMSSSSSSKTG